MTTTRHRMAEALPGLDRPALWMGIVSVLLLSAAFHTGLGHMLSMWSMEEYSHAWIIPPLALLMAVQRLEGFTPRPADRRGLGLGLVAAAFLMLGVGEMSGIFVVVNHGYLLGLIGLAVVILGASGAWRVRGPLAYLLFMLPLPKPLYFALSAKMQVWSSELGVMLLRLLGVAVHLEGNVIDLGLYRLEVAEACNGLRYLFPLLSFGVLAALLLRDAAWKRAVLVLSTLPITLIMNSARIAMIGLLVDRHGIAMAEGAQHLVEGFAVFGLCIAVLLAEVWLLLRLPPRGGRFEALAILWPSAERLASLGRAPVGRAQWAALALIVAGGALVLPLSARQAPLPPRVPLTYFPMQAGGWAGAAQEMDPVYVRVLRLDDYVQADYRRRGVWGGVNLLISYYEDQRFGATPHSPQECIPGDGWTIETFATQPVPLSGTAAATVNRAVITRQGVRQVVYYWFEQRGRAVTNEYLLKGYILLDALTRGRTDGAMVRLVSPVNPGETEADADARLTSFLQAVHGLLPRYIPS